MDRVYQYLIVFVTGFILLLFWRHYSFSQTKTDFFESMDNDFIIDIFNYNDVLKSFYNMQKCRCDIDLQDEEFSYASAIDVYFNHKDCDCSTDEDSVLEVISNTRKITEYADDDTPAIISNNDRQIKDPRSSSSQSGNLDHLSDSSDIDRFRYLYKGYSRTYVDYPDTVLLDEKQKQNRIDTEPILDIPSIQYDQLNWRTVIDLHLEETKKIQSNYYTQFQRQVVLDEDGYTKLSIVNNNIETLLEAENLCYNPQTRKYVFHVHPEYNNKFQEFLTQFPFLTKFWLSEVRDSSLSSSFTVMESFPHSWFVLVDRPRNALHFVETYQFLMRIRLYPSLYPPIEHLFTLHFPNPQSNEWSQQYLNMLLSLFPNVNYHNSDYVSSQVPESQLYCIRHAYLPLEQGQFQGFLYSSIREALFTRFYFYKYLNIKLRSHCFPNNCYLKATLALRDSNFSNQNGGRIIMNQNDVVLAFSSFPLLKTQVAYFERFPAFMQIRITVDTDIYYGIYGGNLINSIYLLPNSAVIISFEENFHSEWIINMLHMNDHHPYIIYNETNTPCPSSNPFGNCDVYFHNQNTFIDIKLLKQYINAAQNDVLLRKYSIANYNINHI